MLCILSNSHIISRNPTRNARRSNMNDVNFRKIQQDIKNHQKKQPAYKKGNYYNDLPRAINYSLPERGGQRGTVYFREALRNLNDMLEGKTKLDLKKAVFFVESAYYENRMDYNQFDK